MKFNSRHIRKILNESLFNPSEKTGPLAVIIQQADPSFYETRAIEMIIEAKQSIPMMTEHQKTVYADKISKAISLLALAKLIRLS